MTRDKQQVKIPTPLGRRIRLIQRHFLPVAVWSVALAVVLVIGQRGTTYIDAVGIVEVREVAVAPLYDGVIQNMMVEMFDQVEAGDVVAVMDDSLVMSELKIAQAQLSQLRAELTAERDRLQLAAVENQMDVQRKFILDEEAAHLDYLDRFVQRQTNEVILERLGVQLDRQKLLLAKDITDQATYDETRLVYKEVKTDLEENRAAIELATQRIEEARRRREEHEREQNDVQLPHLLGPFVENVRVQDALIQEISERRKHLVLRAPLSGTVCQVFHRMPRRGGETVGVRIARSGETVVAGDPLLTIADSQSKRVVAYVDERSARGIEVGAPVELSTRDYPRKVVTARLLKVGSRIEEFPMRLRRNPIISQWGITALVGELPTDIFLPGEFVHLRFVRSRSARVPRTEV